MPLTAFCNPKFRTTKRLTFAGGLIIPKHTPLTPATSKERKLFITGRPPELQRLHRFILNHGGLLACSPHIWLQFHLFMPDEFEPIPKDHPCST